MRDIGLGTAKVSKKNIQLAEVRQLLDEARGNSKRMPATVIERKSAAR